jgi:O-antigen/teichoic acid export membrane protein
VSAEKHGKFLSHVTKLASAQVISLVLGLITAPIFGRLFAPEQVGTFTLFFSVVTLLTIFGTMHYEIAVVLPKDDDDAINVWTAGALILAVWSAVLGLAAVFGVGHMLLKTKYAAIAPFLWLVPLAMIIGNLGSLVTYWLNRKQQFGVNAASSVLASVCNQVGSIGGGWLGFRSAAGLIAVNLVAQVASLAVRIRAFWQLATPHWRKVSVSGVLAMLKRYRKFPLVEIWASFLNTLSTQLAPLLLAYYFSSEIVGQYAQGMRLIQLPTLLVGGAITQVFYSQASAALHDNRLPALVQKVMEGLVLVGSFPFLVLALYGDVIFGVLLGVRWVQAGVYAQILAGWCFLVFCGSPVSSIALVLDRQGELLLFNILTVVLRALTLVGAGLLGSPRLAITLYSLVGIGLWLVFLSALFHFASMPVLKSWTTHLKALMPTAVAAIPLLAARMLILGSSVRLLAVLFITLSYLGYMVWRHPLYRSVLNMVWNALANRRSL